MEVQSIPVGQIKGQQARFIVPEDKTIVFQYGDKTFGSYIAKAGRYILSVQNGFADI